MIQMFWLSILSLAAAGLGARIARLLKISSDVALERFVFGIGLGLGGLAYLTLLIGVFRGFHPVFLRVFLVGLILISYKDLIRIIQEGFHALREGIKCGRPWYEKFLIVLIVIHVALNGISAFAPLSYADALIYHFTIPKEYLTHRGICYLPYMMGNFPLNVHMIYLLGMATGGETTAVLFCWLTGVLVCLTLYLFARRYVSTFTALLAVALFYTTPTVTLLSSSGHVELGLTFFTLLSVFAFTRWIELRQAPWLTASGILIGLAVGTKLYAFASLAVMLFIIGALWLWPFPFGFSQRISFLKALSLCMGFGAIAAIVGSPWVIKNLVYTGNPVYPALYSIFGGRDWSEGPLALWQLKSAVASGTGRDVWNFILLPWNITFYGERFNAGRAGFGPVLLCFLPALFVKLRISRKQWPYCFFFVFSLGFTLFWFLFALQRGKHLMPIAPLVSVLIAWTAVWLIRVYPTLLRFACSLVLVVVLFFGLCVNVIYCAQFLPVVSGLESREEFLSKKLHYYEDVEWMNQNLPPGANLVYLEGLLNYHLQMDHVWASEISQGYIDWANIPDTDALLKRFKEVGATHLMLNKAKFENVQPHTKQILEGLKKTSLEEIYSSTRIVAASRTLSLGSLHVDVQVYQILYPERIQNSMD